MKRTIDSAIFLAVITALLFSWSTAHYHGFLRVAQLDPDTMERSFYQAIYSGMVVSFLPILLLLFFTTVILFVYSHTILPIYIDYVRSGVKAKRRVVKSRRYWIGKRVSPSVEVNSKNHFNKSALFAFSGGLFILSLVYFERQGQDTATEILNAHLSGENSPSNMVTVKVDGETKVLTYLGCGSNNCAGIEEKTNIVFIFPQSNGYSFKYESKM